MLRLVVDGIDGALGGGSRSPVVSLSNFPDSWFNSFLHHSLGAWKSVNPCTNALLLLASALPSSSSLFSP